MVKLASSEKIGNHLDELIDQKYGEQKAFCRYYLELIGEEYEDTQSKEGRFSKIINDRGNLQAYDLLTISELLGVSCEDIVTAGRRCIPSYFHVTNRDVAYSDDSALWKRYVNQKQFLNADEFRKSVIDYALEAKNVLFLKYLVEEELIKIIEYNDHGRCLEVETKIKYYNGEYCNDQFGFEKSDRLRSGIMLLAIESGNCELLDLMHARETYELDYMIKNNSCNYDRVDINNGMIDSVVEAVALSENSSVLKYFSDEYSLFDKNCSIIYPFIGKIIEKMIENERFEEAEQFLINSVEHNKNAFEMISTFLNDEIIYQFKEVEKQKKEEMIEYLNNGLSFERRSEFYPTEDEIRNRTMQAYKFDVKNNVVSCDKREIICNARMAYNITAYDNYEFNGNDCLFYNLIVVEKSKNVPEYISNLISELNSWNDKFVAMNDERTERLRKLYGYH